MNKKIKKAPGSKVFVPKYVWIGRPTSYTDEMLLKTIEYLDECDRCNEIPYIQELELILGVDDDVIVNWTKAKFPDDHPQKGEPRFPDFAAAIKRLKRMQELKLLRSSMHAFSSTGSIFQLKTNHGYVETEKKIIDAHVKSDDVKSLAELTKQRLEHLRGQDTPNQQ